MKKILETKKDYEKLQQSSKPGEKVRSRSATGTWKAFRCYRFSRFKPVILFMCLKAIPLPAEV